MDLFADIVGDGASPEDYHRSFSIFFFKTLTFPQIFHWKLYCCPNDQKKDSYKQIGKT